jgi:hypothetical protein
MSIACTKRPISKKTCKFIQDILEKFGEEGPCVEIKTEM